MRKHLIAIAVAAALAGCESGPEYWSGAQVRHQNNVEWILIDHHVMFAPSSSKLSADEQSKLVAFLNRQDADPRDVVYVSSGGAGDALDKARHASVQHELGHAGLRGEPNPAAHKMAVAADDHVTVTIGRYIVIPPDCPDWRKPSGYDPNNTQSSNFGCATEANLGLMVADPRDLVVGRTPGPAEGGVMARAVNIYRAGRTAKAGAPSTK